MKRLLLLLLLVVSLSLSSAAAENKSAKTKTPRNTAPLGGPWKFAISGDSRNCGDVVMPAIAANARKEGVAFYWHLGDLRWIGKIDEDIASRKGKPQLSLEQYRAMAWQDFIDHQVRSWGETPVFLGIGNHETYNGKTRQEFLKTFRKWVDQPAVDQLRRHDDPNDRDPHTYFHWIEHGVDFIYLDNASPDQFSDAQMDWFSGVLQRAAKNPDVRALILGMHAPLPNSFGKNHAMDDWNIGISSGTRAYHMLLDFKEKSGKAVTLIASHQHFYMPNVYDTPYWQQHGGVLPGYIVGSGGAHRYPIPGGSPSGSKSMVYGYLLGTADPSGAVQFDYREVQESEVPEEVRERYAPEFVHWCFAENGDHK